MNDPSSDDSLIELLHRVARGDCPVADAAGQIAALSPPGIPNIPNATIDLDRSRRCGFGEVIFGQGKTIELMCDIVRSQLDAGENCLITRIDNTAAVQMRRLFPYTHHNPLARTLRVGRQPMPSSESDASSDSGDAPHVAVVTAGSTDAAVAEEAAETLDWMEVTWRRYADIGVAGPQRLLSVVPQLRAAAAIVVIAGMEGALPPALAGHVAAPVIAVPTSIGYGTNFGGLTPLMGMLTSCAANVAVVNIDAGFKGGYMAGLIASRIAAAKKETAVEENERQSLPSTDSPV